MNLVLLNFAKILYCKLNIKRIETLKLADIITMLRYFSKPPKGQRYVT